MIEEGGLPPATPPAGSAPPAGGQSLVVRRHGTLLAEHPIGEYATIGRTAGNSVVLDHRLVSRIHAIVLERDGRWYVQDVGSKNGIYVGGRRVARAVLEPGAGFRIGDFELELVAGEEAGRQTPATLTRGPREEGLAEGSTTFLGRSPAVRALLADARRVSLARGSALVTGESGSGKGVIARLIHDWSARAGRPFVAVNCAAVPAELVESELFGHRRGAFTGALADRAGKFRNADGGTLFLDEVADMSLAAQAKVLTAIDERRIDPLGADRSIAIDIRVIAATNHDLDQAVAGGRFRADLLYRLAPIRLAVPPLRQRGDDVVLLANHFLEQLAADIPSAYGCQFTAEALEALLDHPWPGNVRELRNRVERALTFLDGPAIRPEHLGLGAGAPAAGEARFVPRTLDEVERRHIGRSLAHHGGNIMRTARALGIQAKTLRAKMQRLGLDRAPGAGEPEDGEPDS